MSFGFSVGDFLTVGKLIADIIGSLSDAGGARSDYQDLLRELECLDQALRRLDKLSAAPPSSSQSLDSIKYAALSCRRPLEEFLAKIKGYDNSLGVYSKPGAVVKEKWDRVRWSMGKKEEVARLQNYLSVHVGTVNVLLAEYGLETLGTATGKAEVFQSHVRERLEGVRYILGDIEGNTIAQRQAVEANNSLLTKVYQVVCGEVSVGWKSLVNMVSTVCVTTQQIYGVVLEIRSTLSAPDTRWTFFQDPFLVEDALGRRFPIPSEYDFNLMNVVIQARFEEGPGSEDVRLGNYELVQTRNSKYAISSGTYLRPGTMITMAIVVEKGFWDTRGQVCPIFSCGSSQAICASGGGFIWLVN
ncbi:hypothetical protein SLS55_006148 [Diplodia seriata]|uniref:Ubiquitin-like domain-containing protein n=1 Tax=Diplodia seriata TaxID=420778 RepID=A0ABR3CG15_9PEZI